MMRWLERAAEEDFKTVTEQRSPDPGHHKVRAEETLVMWSHPGFIPEDKCGHACLVGTAILGTSDGARPARPKQRPSKEDWHGHYVRVLQ